MTRPPSPLLAVLAIALVVGIAWTLAVAPLQQPDEPNHLARVQRQVEGGTLKTKVTRDWSADEALFAGTVDTLAMPGFVTVKPPWTEAADRAYRDAAGKLGRSDRADADAPTTADGNPPAYYAFAGLGYRLGGVLATRVWTMRLLGLVWPLITVAGTWLLLGELFRRDRLLQAVGSLGVALQPMFGSISSAVSPDGMVIALSTLTLWLSVRLLRRGLTWQGVAAIAGVYVLTVVTKSTALALLPAVVLAVAIALVRRRWPGLRATPARLALWTGGAAGLLALLYLALRYLIAPHVAQVHAAVGNLPDLRRFASYLVQFYTGPHGGLDPVPNLGTQSRFDVTWIKQAWGLFGALDAPLPGWSYTFVLVAGLLALAAALYAVVRARRRLDAGAAVVLVLAVLCTVLGLHLTEYNLLVSLTSGPILQGRYALPLVAIGGVVVAAAVSALPVAWRPVGGGLIVASGLMLTLLGLSAALLRFYAS